MKKVLEWIGAIVLALMFATVMTTVVFRNFLSLPSRWSVELSQYMFVIIVMTGAAAAMKDEKHIRIDTILFLLPEKVQRPVRILGRLLMAPFLYVLVSGSFHNIRATWYTYLPTVRWFRIGWMYTIVMVCGVLMSVYLLINLVKDILGKYEPEFSVMGTDISELGEDLDE